MKIVTTRDIARQTKAMFELAEKEDVIVKRGEKYFQIVEKEMPHTKLVTDKWLDEFFEIPAEYRCNPFDISPSGDLFFADKRNIEQIERGKEQARKGQGRAISIDEIKQMCGI
jgi:hypothetical protein